MGATAQTIEVIAEKRRWRHNRHCNGNIDDSKDHPVDIYEDPAARFVTPIIERRKAEGAQAQNELWQAWLRRKQQDQAQGQDFYESHPGEDQNSNT